MIVLAAIVVLIVALRSGGGGSLSPSSALAWDETPTVIKPTDLPRDRVTFGTIRNNGLREIQINADDLEVQDANGNKVLSSERFIASFAHGLYGAFQQPDSMPEPEQIRLGYLAKLNPGDKSPLLVSVHLDDSSKLPLRVFYKGSPVLDIPRGLVTAG